MIAKKAQRIAMGISRPRAGTGSQDKPGQQEPQGGVAADETEQNTIQRCLTYRLNISRSQTEQLDEIQLLGVLDLDVGPFARGRQARERFTDAVIDLCWQQARK